MENEMPEWERELRERLEKELPDGPYKIESPNVGVIYTGKKGQINFEVAMVRAAKEMATESPSLSEQLLESQKYPPPPLDLETFRKQLYEFFKTGRLKNDTYYDNGLWLQDTEYKVEKPGIQETTFKFKLKPGWFVKCLGKKQRIPRKKKKAIKKLLLLRMQLRESALEAALVSIGPGLTRPMPLHLLSGVRAAQGTVMENEYQWRTALQQEPFDASKLPSHTFDVREMTREQIQDKYPDYTKTPDQDGK